MTQPKKGGAGVPNPNGDDGKGHQQARKVSGKIHVEGEIKTQLPPKLIEDYATSNEKTDRRVDKRFLVEIITLLFVIIVAIMSFLQTKQAIKSADAAQKSTSIANQSLHIAERAYLNLGPMTPSSFNSKTKTLVFSIVNTGHLPAEDLKLTFYKLAANVDSPSAKNVREDDVVDFGKTYTHAGTINPMPAGSPNTIAVYIDNMDTERADAGLQKIVIGGVSTYKAGFDDEGPKNWSFCFETEHEPVRNINTLIECDINHYLPIFEMLARTPKWTGK